MSNQVTEIKNLNPYARVAKMVLRVLAKSDVRDISTKNGPSCVASLDLIDKNSETIRLRVFGDQARTMHTDVSKGKVYEFTALRVSLANAKYNAGVSSSYELAVTDSSVITPVDADDGSIPSIPNVDLLSIEQLGNVVIPSGPGIDDKNANVTVNFMGILHDYKPSNTIVSKATQKSFTKRSITICDDTLSSMECVLFGDIADQFNDESLQGNPVLFVRNAKVQEYQGVKQVNISFGSDMQLNPTTSRVQALKTWYRTKGKDSSFTPLNSANNTNTSKSSSLSNIPEVSMDDLSDYNMRPDGKTASLLGKLVRIRGYVSNINGRYMVYPSCPNATCGKKRVSGPSPGEYSCQNCGALSTLKYNYLSSISVQDHTGNRLVTMFDEDWTRLLRMTANEFAKDYPQPAKGAEATDVPESREFLDQFKYVSLDMLVRAKMEPNLREEGKDGAPKENVKITCQSMRIVDFPKQTNELIKKLQQLNL